MRKLIFKNKEVFVRNIFILFGFLFSSEWIGSLFTVWLGKLIYINRTFQTSTFIGYSFFIFCRSIPNIIFYLILGLLVPIVIKEDSFIWSIIIGVVIILYKIFTSKIIWGIVPTISDLFSAWFPIFIILPSLVFGTFLFLTVKNRQRIKVKG